MRLEINKFLLYVSKNYSQCKKKDAIMKNRRIYLWGLCNSVLWCAVVSYCLHKPQYIIPIRRSVDVIHLKDEVVLCPPAWLGLITYIRNVSKIYRNYNLTDYELSSKRR